MKKAGSPEKPRKRGLMGGYRKISRPYKYKAAGRAIRPAQPTKRKVGFAMNKTRRKVLLEISGKITDLKDTLEEVLGEEEEYKDNMPENLQESERYSKASEACDSLYEAVSQLEEVVLNIETAAE
jgi:hypothetical protein